ncbi:DUF3631 domain-containing protein [Mesorhizobium sp. B1-1-9]|uniref:DUF3631 domain-containing protein n=1 Tax=Mesorhizobium sp. B1-1-9 TaxID=2589975 RepID=UPI00112E3E49|nr:DUF3631 domain-containing protein [Mesorhizobium sp. B1-1-9]TPN57592.1 DUF3631 domain-containing protein [Mesorhizobium sp. B1-1-9]
MEEDNYAAALLDEVYNFVARFVAYPSEAAHVAHVLWIVHTHMMQAWESTPRIFFSSPEPGSGKTRALEISELLVPNPVEAVNVTPAYLFRKVADEAGAPTILFDEIDTIFGPKAKDNEEIRGLLNAGHRRGAVAGRCVVRGKIIETEEIPAYCAVALAGLGDVPDTILTRSVIIRMRRRSPGEVIEPYRRRVHKPEGDLIYKRLAGWAEFISADIGGAWPEMPLGIKDRDADVWEPLLAVADAAGGDWPERARVSCVSLVSASKVATPSLGIRLLADLKMVFGTNDRISTKTLIELLCGLPESPWSDLKGKALGDTGLADRLKPYGVKSKQIRIGEWTGKGYERTDLHDAWKRYLSAPPHERETPETTETAEAAE